jgi:4-hydroxybenzoate polyprenyltransferase
LVPPVAWWLLVANMFWAIAYDTEYAMVDRDDDKRIGVKTSAILFGRGDVAMTMLCLAVFLVLMAIIGARVKLGPAYFLGVAVAALFGAYQYVFIRERTRAGCFKAFLYNNWVGAALFMGIAADFLFGTPAWMRL